MPRAGLSSEDQTSNPDSVSSLFSTRPICWTAPDSFNTADSEFALARGVIHDRQSSEPREVLTLSAVFKNPSAFSALGMLTR